MSAFITVETTIYSHTIWAEDYDTGTIEAHEIDKKYVAFAFRFLRKILDYALLSPDAYLWRTFISKSPVVVKRLLEDGATSGIAVYLGQYNQALVDVVFLALDMSVFGDIFEQGWTQDGYEIVGKWKVAA